MAAWIPLLVGAVVSAAGTVYTNDQQKKRAQAVEKQQDKLTAAERAAQNFEAAKERRKQIQQAIVAQASITNMSAASGGQDSSAEASGIGYVGAQATGNINTLNTSMMFNNIISNAQTGLNRALQKTPSVGEGIASGFSSAFTNSMFNAFGNSVSTKLFG